MVEFALMAPLAFLLLYGVAELGRAGYDNTVVASAAREGARAAIPVQESGKSVSSVQADVMSAARKSLGGGVNLDTSVHDLSAACSPPSGVAWVCMSPYSTAPGGAGHPTVTVKVVYAFKPLLALVGNVTGSITLSSSTTMRTEY